MDEALPGPGEGAVVGVGVDVADTDRFERLVARSAGRLWAHWFTPAEAAECLASRRPGTAAACRFAVKEATYKAVGVPFAGAARWPLVEVLGRGPDWRVALHGELAAAAPEGLRLQVSTCLMPGRVMAVVIAEDDARDRLPHLY